MASEPLKCSFARRLGALTLHYTSSRFSICHRSGWLGVYGAKDSRIAHKRLAWLQSNILRLLSAVDDDGGVLNVSACESIDLPHPQAPDEHSSVEAKLKQQELFIFLRLQNSKKILQRFRI